MRKARDFLRTIRRSFVSLQNPTPQMDASERYCFSPALRWNSEVEDYFVKAYGAEHFARISKSLTFPSSYSCIRVNILKSTSDAVIEKLLAIIQGTGNENATNVVNSNKSDEVTKCNANQKQQSNLEGFNKLSLGPFENLNSEKERLPSFPISKCQIPGLEYVVFVKGSGPHTIDYGYTREQPPKEVIVSRKCAEAVLRGAQIYVPGIMACTSHVEKGDTVAVSVAIEQPVLDGGWSLGITRGTVLQGSETDPYYFERNRMYIGQGTTMMSRAGIFRASNGLAVDMSNRVFKLTSFYDVLEGEIFLQNLPSIITAHVLDPQKGERILDMCAAPGGKTTAIAILMKDEGEVIATDRSHNKVVDIQNLAAELGLKCITAYKLDALKACQRNEANQMTTFSASTDNDSSHIIHSSSSPKLDVEEVLPIPATELHYDKISEGLVSNEIANERTYLSKAEIRKNLRRIKNGPGRCQAGGRAEKCKGFAPNSFDRVLLDAPCSALGLRPRLFTAEETMNSLRHHARYQKRMFDQAVQLVRPGGVIVYSTCTINPGENEALVRYALDTYKFLSLAQQHPKIGGPGLVGSCEFSDGLTEEWLRPGEEDLIQRFDPSSPLDTIGFFIAKFNVGSKI